MAAELEKPGSGSGAGSTVQILPDFPRIVEHLRTILVRFLILAERVEPDPDRDPKT
ncbi:MAG TPA: hypothetical protein VNA04_13180 [Thermoanaerobaculia bacterium]|nr:hypothetical protein [Thermoanaerobaculia bacterium]